MGQTISPKFRVVQVNPDLLVKGASGLSIIDASILVSKKYTFFGGRIDYMDVSLLLLVPTLRRPLMWLAKEVTRAHIRTVGSNK
jgi:hypothetical protein